MFIPLFFALNKKEVTAAAAEVSDLPTISYRVYVANETDTIATYDRAFLEDTHSLIRYDDYSYGGSTWNTDIYTDNDGEGKYWELGMSLRSGGGQQPNVFNYWVYVVAANALQPTASTSYVDQGPSGYNHVHNYAFFLHFKLHSVPSDIATDTNHILHQYVGSSFAYQLDWVSTTQIVIKGKTSGSSFTNYSNNITISPAEYNKMCIVVNKNSGDERIAFFMNGVKRFDSSDSSAGVGHASTLGTAVTDLLTGFRTNSSSQQHLFVLRDIGGTAYNTPSKVKDLRVFNQVLTDAQGISITSVPAVTPSFQEVQHSGFTGTNDNYIFGFGRAVNSDGSRVFLSSNNNDDEGAVFTVIGTAWETEYTTIPQAFSACFAGTSTLFISRRRGDNSTSDPAYFQRWDHDGSSWSVTQLVSVPAFDAVEFGHHVAVSDDGEVVAVSDRTSNSSAGAIHVFRRSSGTYPTTPTQSLYGEHAWSTISNSSLDADGTTMVVGQPGWHPTNRAQTGAKDGRVTVYTWNGTSYQSSTTLTLARTGAGLGHHVGINSAGTRIMAAEHWSYAGTDGKTYIYEGSGSTWTLTQTISMITSSWYMGHVRMSSDGSAVGIVEISAISASTHNGQLVVYKHNGTEFIRSQGVLAAPNSAEGFGGQAYAEGVAIAGDGSVIAVPQWHNRKAFFYKTTPASVVWADEETAGFPNWAPYGSNSTTLNSIPLFTTSGTTTSSTEITIDSASPFMPLSCGYYTRPFFPTTTDYYITFTVTMGTSGEWQLYFHHTDNTLTDNGSTGRPAGGVAYTWTHAANWASAKYLLNIYNPDSTSLEVRRYRDGVDASIDPAIHSVTHSGTIAVIIQSISGIVSMSANGQSTSIDVSALSHSTTTPAYYLSIHSKVTDLSISNITIATGAAATAAATITMETIDVYRTIDSANGRVRVYEVELFSGSTKVTNITSTTVYLYSDGTNPTTGATNQSDAGNQTLIVDGHKTDQEAIQDGGFTTNAEKRLNYFQGGVNPKHLYRFVVPTEENVDRIKSYYQNENYVPGIKIQRNGVMVYQNEVVPILEHLQTYTSASYSDTTTKYVSNFGTVIPNSFGSPTTTYTTTTGDQVITGDASYRQSSVFRMVGSITSSTTNTLFEFGGSSRGMACYMYGGTLYVQCGDGSASGGQLELSYAVGTSETIIDIALSLSSSQVNSGTCNLFVNLTKVASGTYPDTSDVIGTNEGGIMQKHSSICTTRMGAGSGNSYTLANGTVTLLEVWGGNFLNNT